MEGSITSRKISLISPTQKIKRLAIIPARGGSKRLPRKNLLPLGGKPLISHTIEAVLKSGCFDKIIFSSDNQELLKIASKYHQIDISKRCHSLASDEVKVIDLVRNIAEEPDSKSFDQIGLFLPTCPFRSAIHITQGIELLKKEDYSVVSVCEMKDPLQLSLSVDNETKIANTEAILSPSPLVTGETRSQDFTSYFRVNGGFYIAWMEKFLAKNNFFQGQVKAYIMDNLISVDIDNQCDLDYANMLLEKKYITLE